MQCTRHSGVLRIFYDKVSAMFNLMQSYLSAESNHREILLPVIMALLFSLGRAPHAPCCVFGSYMYYFRFLLKNDLRGFSLA